MSEVRNAHLAEVYDRMSLLYDMVRQKEWHDTDHGQGAFCPWCERAQAIGHDKDCPSVKALAWKLRPTSAYTQAEPSIDYSKALERGCARCSAAVKLAAASGMLGIQSIEEGWRVTDGGLLCPACVKNQGGIVYRTMPMGVETGLLGLSEIHDAVAPPAPVFKQEFPATLDECFAAAKKFSGQPVFTCARCPAHSNTASAWDGWVRTIEGMICPACTERDRRENALAAIRAALTTLADLGP